MVIIIFTYPAVRMNMDWFQEERRQNVFVVEREAKKALNLVTSGDSTPQRNCSPERDRMTTPNTLQFQSIEEEIKVDDQMYLLSYFPSYYRIHRVINVNLFNHQPFQHESQEIVSSIFHLLIYTKPGIPTFALVMILCNTHLSYSKICICPFLCDNWFLFFLLDIVCIESKFPIVFFLAFFYREYQIWLI